MSTFLSMDEAIAALAQCYRLSGADPDGNEDWRLAKRAVEEVRRLREESDAENARLEQENALLKRSLALLAKDADTWKREAQVTLDQFEALLAKIDPDGKLRAGVKK